MPWPWPCAAMGTGGGGGGPGGGGPRPRIGTAIRGSTAMACGGMGGGGGRDLARGALRVAGWSGAADDRGGVVVSLPSLPPPALRPSLMLPRILCAEIQGTAPCPL